MEKLSRGKFLALTSLGLYGVLSNACGEKTSTPQTKLTEIQTQQEAILVVQRLIQEMDSLPDSILKEGLVKQIKPILVRTASEYILGEQRVPLFDPKITIKRSTDQLVIPYGGVSIRGDYPTPNKYPVRDEVVLFPYSGLLTQRELAQWPKADFSPDGKVPLARVNHAKDKPLLYGIAPYFEIIKPEDRLIPESKKREYAFYEQFIYFKEAFGLLVPTSYLAVNALQMKRLGLPTAIQTRDDQGKIMETEVLISAYGSIFNKGTRLQASTDLGSYFLTAHAVKGTDLFKFMTEEGPNKDIYQEIAQTPLGNDLGTAIFNSLRWAITSPSASRLVHEGNISIPF